MRLAISWIRLLPTVSTPGSAFLPWLLILVHGITKSLE